ncbi:MAG: hypothetical protein ACKOVB_22275 [Terrabacter sp.]
MSTSGSTYGSTAGLSLQEAVARELIHERVAARHHAPKAVRVRRSVRAAVLLRSLAERLDPSATRPAATAPAPVVPLHAGSPRPWAAQQRPVARRAPHRHS